MNANLVRVDRRRHNSSKSLFCLSYIYSTEDHHTLTFNEGHVEELYFVQGSFIQSVLISTINKNRNQAFSAVDAL